MCGLAGLIALDIRLVPARAIDAMRDAIGFRGRDAHSEWTDERYVRLAHSRLSIIDLESGGQPMRDVDGRLTIVFTGEIYNYIELRAEYERRGARFRTHSDTEVILEGFKLRGPAVCEDLNGMFAFALWDSARRELTLARDHLGKKPLFWYATTSFVAFSSTLRAFEGLEGWTGELSAAGVALYSILSNFPEDVTVYKQARRIPYASWAVVAPGDSFLKPRRYWRMSFGEKSSQPFASALDEYGALVSDATRIRLRSDVPVALTFSAGVDSGTIAAVAARVLRVPLRCCTIDSGTLGRPSPDSVRAREVAQLLGLDWQHVPFDMVARPDPFPTLDQAYNQYDEPCQNMNVPLSQQLYAAMKPHATVVLSGNGADELFSGYVGDERIRQQDLALRMVPSLRRIPHSLRRGPFSSPYFDRPLLDAWVDTVLAAAPLDGIDAEEVAERLRVISAEMAACGVQDRMDLQMFLQLTCMTADSNYRIPDISGLVAQVEVRSPFLDVRIVEFAARLPHAWKVARMFSPDGNKHLPKAFYERYVPQTTARVPKRGLGYDMRLDRKIHDDPAFLRAFADAYASLESFGIPAGRYRNAWNEYVRRPLAAIGGSPYAPLMVNGFMLSEWLTLRERSRAIPFLS